MKIVTTRIALVSHTWDDLEGQFSLEWHSDGTVSFTAHNGKLVGTKKSGHLFANCDSIEENTRYYFYLINRPILVLKCDQGFVGYKGAGSVKLECNKATYETIQVERVENGLVLFKGQIRNAFIIRV